MTEVPSAVPPTPDPLAGIESVRAILNGCSYEIDGEETYYTLDSGQRGRMLSHLEEADRGLTALRARVQEAEALVAVWKVEGREKEGLLAVGNRLNELEAALVASREREARLEKQIAEHQCGLPDSIKEALNSGDGSYHP